MVLMTLFIRDAIENDLAELALLNKQLIEDEGSCNPMNLAQLEERMRGWLKGDWKIKLFYEETVPQYILGYTLYQIRQDEYDPMQQSVYLRQMFVRREKRSQGLGRQVLKQLVKQYMPPEARIEIDVLSSNPSGERFWHSMGFKPYFIQMRLECGK
jgi:GNAT superfamily N-acetyltransferase